MTRKRSVSEWAGIAIALIAIWQVVALFNVSEFLRFAVITGGQFGADEVLYYQMATSLVWAMFTPFMIAIAERLPVERPYRLRNVLLLALLAPILSVVRAAVGGLIFQLGASEDLSLDFVTLSIDIRFHRNLFLIVVIIVITNLVLAQRRASASERNELALQAAVANAELERLRANTEPRFVFAMLEAAGKQIRSSPATADRMLVQLGDLLRQNLGERHEEMTLGGELELVDRYFELEKTRSGDRFTTHVDLDESLLSARVPPLLLHPLVESMLATAPDGEHRLEISAAEADGQLVIEIRNRHTDTLPEQGALDETRGRLYRTFAERASLRVARNGSSVTTELSMPLERSGEA